MDQTNYLDSGSGSFAGEKTANIADGAVQLSSSEKRLARSIIISPKADNDGSPRVGPAGSIQPNSVPFMYPPIEGRLYCLQDIYVKVDADGDGVEWEAIY
jgi:hypothetical protein